MTVLSEEEIMGQWSKLDYKNISIEDWHKTDLYQEICKIMSPAILASGITPGRMFGTYDIPRGIMKRCW